MMKSDSSARLLRRASEDTLPEKGVGCLILVVDEIVLLESPYAASFVTSMSSAGTPWIQPWSGWLLLSRTGFAIASGRSGNSLFCATSHCQYPRPASLAYLRSAASIRGFCCGVIAGPYT